MLVTPGGVAAGYIKGIEASMRCLSKPWGRTAPSPQGTASPDVKEGCSRELPAQDPDKDVWHS